MQIKNTSNQSFWQDCLFLVFVLGGLFFILLGTRPLFVPDEGRYAEIAREMAASGDYVTPYLNGIKYFEKPILYYWLGAFAIKIAGLTLWSIRSINGILGLLGCLLTYVAVRKLYDRFTGLLSAFILATSFLYFVMAHMISLDLTITVFLTLCLYTYLLGSEIEFKQTHYLFYASAVFAALAMLTKGLIGVVFPVLIIGTHSVLFRKPPLSIRQFMVCLIIFFAIVIPWHVLVEIRNPGFFHFYFIEQHFLRYATTEIGHYQPAWFFIPCLILGFFPWIVFLPQTLFTLIRSSLKECQLFRKELFFFLWALIIFVFFSFSKSKLIPYILPVFPPLAILTARYLSQCLTQQKKKGIKIGLIALVLFSFLISFYFYRFVSTAHLPNQFFATIYLEFTAFCLVTGSVIAAIFAFINQRKAIVITIITIISTLLILLASTPYVDTRTILPLATILQADLKNTDDIVAYNQYYQDLPFYLNRKVSILNWRNELAFGMKLQNTQEWMLNDKTFWQRWQSTQRVYAIMGAKEYIYWQNHYTDKKIYLIGRTINNVLVSNMPKF